MAKPEFQSRINFDGEFDSVGRLFVCPETARITDLSGVKILNCSVDTVRQLYRGTLRTDIYQLFSTPQLVEFGGYQWFSGRVGRDSGYQYRLQNNDLGLILLIKNFNVSDQASGPHLKIEASPHLIESMAPVELQSLMNGLAIQVLTDIEPNQCAIHLAVDLQGWEPPRDLVARMHCRSRRVREITGIDSVDWAGKSSVYGDGETYMFGAASGLQLSIYNKTRQARHIDKLDYWQGIWHRHDNPFDADDPQNYDPEQDVWRIEMRFHHSIIHQFALGSVDLTTNRTLDTCMFGQMEGHLDGLWRYGMTAFKLLDSPKVYSGIWSLLAQDAWFTCGVKLHDTEYRRAYKTAGGFSGKNVELFLGNFVSLLARERVGAKKAFDRLQEWECWPVIRDHFADKGKSEQDIYRWLRDKLTERIIRYGVAV